MTDKKAKDDGKEPEGPGELTYWPIDPVLLYLADRLLTPEEFRKAVEDGKREHEEAMKRRCEQQKKESKCED